MRKCKQCGRIQNLDEFRQYYTRPKVKAGRPPGRYRTCKTCERINNRLKYLNRKKVLTDEEQAEVESIEELYEVLRAQGLEPPNTKDNSGAVTSLVNDLLNEAKQSIEEAAAAGIPVDVPKELQRWLTGSLEGQDPEYLEEVSDRLWETYMPQTGVDDKYNPIYDETYKDILTKIQDRFDTYEDEFYGA